MFVSPGSSLQRKSPKKLQTTRSTNPPPATATTRVNISGQVTARKEGLANMTPSWEALLNSLLSRGRNLRIEMTRALLDNEPDYTEPSNPYKQSYNADAIRTAWSIDPLTSDNELTFEERMVDLVFGNRLTSDEVRAVNAVNQSESLISSEDEFEDDSLPIAEEEALTELLFVKKINPAEPSKLNKSEESIKRGPTAQWNYGATKDGKSRPPMARPKTTTNDARKKLTMPYERPGATTYRKPTEQKQQSSRKSPDSHFCGLEVRDLSCDFDRPTKFDNVVLGNPVNKILHCLLSIPEGKDFDFFYRMAEDASEKEIDYGLFLVSRMLCTGNASRSDICGNLSNPRFSFKQLSAVLITPDVLINMKNNVMVVEVWLRSLRQLNDDKLVGLCKLPLHLFYLSLRDSDTANTFLWRQQLIVAVDEFLPVMDVFSRKQVGALKIFLAMGHVQQNVERVVSKSSPSISSRPNVHRGSEELQGSPNRKFVSFTAETEEEFQAKDVSIHSEVPSTIAGAPDASSGLVSEADSLLLDVNVEQGVRIAATVRDDSGFHSCCVSVWLSPFDIVSHFVDFSENLCWDWSSQIRFPVAVLAQQNMCIVFKVWIVPKKNTVSEDWKLSEDDNAVNIGFTTLDISPLLSGMNQLCGYYNVLDLEGLCKGQLKISVKPLSNLSCFKADATESTSVGNPTSGAAGYATTGFYSEFPSHVMRFTEQKLLFCEPKCAAENSDAPALNNINNLETSMTDCSRSFLISSLSTKLSELEVFTKFATTRLDENETFSEIPSTIHNTNVSETRDRVLEGSYSSLSAPLSRTVPQPTKNRKSRLAAAIFGFPKKDS